MAPHHNNQLNMVGLFDSDETYDSPGRVSRMLWSAQGNTNNAKGANIGYLHDYEPAPQVNHDFASRLFEPDHFIVDSMNSQDQKQDDDNQVMSEDGVSQVSYTPPQDSDYYESACEDRQSSKTTKINKDGAPRKPRQPRPKLLKWSDTDWKNVVLGITWACGETGVQIPFDQAAQIVGENCTAGALQQAILKLRGKQIAEGYQIPSLKMAWTRKNRNRRSSSPIANAKTMQVQAPAKTRSRRHTIQKNARSLIVKLRFARRSITSMQPEITRPPVKKMPSSMPAHAQRPRSHQHPRQDHMQAVQQHQEWISKVEEPTVNSKTESIQAVNEVYGNSGSLVHGVYGAQQYPQSGYGFDMGPFQNTFGESAVPVENRKLYNRNHVIMDDLLVDQNDNIMGTAEQLRSFEGIVTPENNPFASGYLPDMSNQAILGHGTSHGPNAEYGQEHNSFHPPQPDFVNFSDFTDYTAYTTGENNQGPLEDVFKTESYESQPYNNQFFH